MTRQPNVPPMMFSAYPKSERYIAVSHRLEVLLEESNLSQAWEAVVKFCGTIRCEVVSSSITTRSKECGRMAYRALAGNRFGLFAKTQA
jgi:hypothetical protein